MIEIANKKLYQEGGVYVGRPSVLGNPYPLKDEKDRDVVIEKYGVWLRKEYAKRGKVYAALMELAHQYAAGEDIVLVCWCAPRRCHAEVIRDAIIGIVAGLQ